MACGGLTSTLIFAAIVYFIVRMIIKANAAKSSEKQMDQAIDEMSQKSRRERRAADDAGEAPVQVNPRARWTSDSVVVEAQQDDSRDQSWSGTREVYSPERAPEPKHSPSVIVDRSEPAPPPPPPASAPVPAPARTGEDSYVVIHADADAETPDSKEVGAAQTGEPVTAEQLLLTLAAKGALSAQAEDEVEDRWRGNGVYGRGEVVMSQQVFGNDLDFDVSEGTKFTVKIELPGESQLLSPRAILLVKSGKGGPNIKSQQKVDFQGTVRGYRSIVRTLLVEDAEVWPAEN